MKATLRWTIVSITAVLSATAAARAGSIWAKANCKQALHSDDTASKLGDILTIIIDERTVIGNKSNKRQL